MLLKEYLMMLKFTKASEQGALFGSVTAEDVINELNTVNDLSLKAKDLIIKHVIKNVGGYRNA